MKEIKLTNSDKVVLVDDEDYERISEYKWRLHTNGTYAERIGSNEITGKQKKIYMHRDVMNIIYNKNIFIDHINANKLDNRKENLRFCTRSQNNKNVSTDTNRTKNSSSKYKGVNWYKKYCKWNAKIRCNGRDYNLGYFNNELEAAEAYDRAAIFLHKEFCNLNFPSNKYDMSDYKMSGLSDKKTSKFFGVHVYRGKYKCSINILGKSIYIGSYENEDFAAKIVDKYIIKNNVEKLYGKINFPELIDDYKKELGIV